MQAFYCNRIHVLAIVSIHYAFITGVRCPLNKIIYLVYSWATKRSLSGAIEDVDVGKKMGINVYQWCRDICSWSLINGPAIKLGGPGQVVEIDESVFTHQGKVSVHTSILNTSIPHSYRLTI